MTSSSDRSGFTLVEVLVALALSTLLLLLLAQLWTGVEKRSADITDRLVWQLQARVAGIRLKHDLRSACAVGGGSAGVPSLLLEADGGRLVMLARTGSPADVELVAWEISGARLMRRRGDAATVTGPLPSGGWHFIDHKTMLEPVEEAARFRYYSEDRELVAPLSPDGLLLADRVQLEAVRRGAVGPARQVLLCSAGLGR
ncbi:MAG: prepilin-type N-terminal cleavage/methylation domain-containing protein [Gaiellales bacterium]|nr:prepilin-type N-terminal cleavage/methylation domain-containing protein [Gaiellales bacterium]